MFYVYKSYYTEYYRTVKGYPCFTEQKQHNGIRLTFLRTLDAVFAKSTLSFRQFQPTMANTYDPLDYENLPRSVVTALLESASPPPPPPPEKFSGSGVYVLYYTGSLSFYSHVASSDLHKPIYVGKAVPTGTRKGGRRVDSESSAELYRRLHDHAKSIEQAENLALGKFRVHHLVVIPVWIRLAERFLIDHFRPVWNTVIDGFGNHPPGLGRRDMRRPRWDIVHPGLPWAAKLRAAEKVEEIIRLIGTRDR